MNQPSIRIAISYAFRDSKPGRSVSAEPGQKGFNHLLLTYQRTRPGPSGPKAGKPRRRFRDKEKRNKSQGT
ncbi:MAG: hypothetical protein ACPGYV_06905, partial [Phycisphaeraceae bacterium]